MKIEGTVTIDGVTISNQVTNEGLIALLSPLSKIQTCKITNIILFDKDPLPTTKIHEWTFAQLVTSIAKGCTISIDDINGGSDQYHKYH